jgi:preprotein translocase subunit SecE
MSTLANQKGEAARTGGFWSELFRFGIYKPHQGRIVRQLSFLALAILLCLAAIELHRFRLLDQLFTGARYLFLMVFIGLALWVSYRVVNYSRFADFLIAVEAEMNKVSWPTKQELWRASLVVIFVIFAMAIILYFFDIVWTLLFQFIGIRYVG